MNNLSKPVENLLIITDLLMNKVIFLNLRNTAHLPRKLPICHTPIYSKFSWPWKCEKSGTFRKQKDFKKKKKTQHLVVMEIYFLTK